MDLSLFDYKYPKELIAQVPLERREDSRMMVLNRANKTITHSSFKKILEFLKPDDLLTLNNTKVVPARLVSKENVECLLLEEKEDNKWTCLVKPGRKAVPSKRLSFEEGLTGTIEEVLPEGERVMQFSKMGTCTRYVSPFSTSSLRDIIEKIGHPPTPPYIKRTAHDDRESTDKKRYQTVFAEKPGSAAAPTAGFHFTKDILWKTGEKGVEIKYITLHVGTDTFLPVRVDDILAHKMHGERYEIPEETAGAILDAKSEGRRVIAVGTTSVRALESSLVAGSGWHAAGADLINAGTQEGDAGGGPPMTHSPPGRRASISGGVRRQDPLGGICETSSSNPSRVTTLFIYPGYKFKAVDAILTNFHQPKSTLLMLVSAFAGREFILEAYQEAIRHSYRLFSYGDCMLIT